MKLSFLILTFALTSLAHAANPCDLKQLEDDYEAAAKPMAAQLEAAIARDEKASVDMSPYLKIADALRACQKKVDPKNVSPCSGFSIWAEKNLSPNFLMERYFEVVQNRGGKCVQDSTFQYTIRNQQRLQILYYRDGSYVMTHVVPGKSNSGIPTGRTFLFSDGQAAGKSGAFIVDFPEPLDKYDISLFWGMNLTVGNGVERLERILQGVNLTFKWNNGAYITIDSLSEDIIDSNFLDPISYKPVCYTDQDTSPKGRTRYFPKVDFLPGADRYVGQPELIQ